MLDLDVAKTELYEENLSVCIVKGCSVLFKAEGNAVTGLLDALCKCGNGLAGSALACRNAGRAVAFLCAHAKFKEVFAASVTRTGLAVFKHEKISCRWNELVDKVPAKADMQGFENAVAEAKNPAKAYATLKALGDKLPHSNACTRERFISKQNREI